MNSKQNKLLCRCPRWIISVFSHFNFKDKTKRTEPQVFVWNDNRFNLQPLYCLQCSGFKSTDFNRLQQRLHGHSCRLPADRRKSSFKPLSNLQCYLILLYNCCTAERQQFIFWPTGTLSVTASQIVSNVSKSLKSTTATMGGKNNFGCNF